MEITNASKALKIRPFESADIAKAHTLSRNIGWPQTMKDWQFLTEHARGYVAILDGQFVGITLYWLFGTDVASIGAVMVDDNCRGRGIAGQLLKRSFEDLEGRNLLLYATEAGMPLYAKSGFAPFEVVEQHQGVTGATDVPNLPTGATVHPFRPELSDTIVRLAEQATRIDRSKMMRSLIERSHGYILFSDGQPTGFALHRRYGRGWGLGPVVAKDAESGRTLIQRCLADLSGQFVRIDVLTDLQLDTWLENFGLHHSGSAVGMQRGILPKGGGTFKRIAITTQAMG